jgi:hypothetical protein
LVDCTQIKDLFYENKLFQAYHIVDSLIVNDPTDPYGILQFLLPGGPFTYRMKNVTFAGGPTIPAAIAAPQHCGLIEYNDGMPGSKCNVQVCSSQQN